MKKIYVSDMSCKHCVAKIEKVLLLNDVKASVLLEDKSVTLGHDDDYEKAVTLIKQVGYQAK